jgi:hypothetical protein
LPTHIGRPERKLWEISLVILARHLLDGQPYALPATDPETVRMLREFADYMGVTMNVVADESGMGLPSIAHFERTQRH